MSPTIVSRRHSLPTLVGILEDKDQFKRRFLLIGKFTRSAYGWSLLGILAVGILAATCLTKAKAADTPKSPKADTGTNVTVANTQMLEAVRKGDVASVQKLIDQGTDPKALTDDKRTLLFFAGSPEVAEILIAHGVDPNARDKQGDVALSFLSRRPGGKKGADTARVLMKHGADPNVRVGEMKETPLLGAYDGEMVDALVENGADLKATMTNGNGVLANAATHSLDVLQALLRHGVTFDAKTGEPAMLMTASWQGNAAIAQWLLEHGVDPNTPGLWATVNGKPDMMLPLQAAAVTGQLKVAQMLLDHGAKGDDQMLTALYNRNNKLVKLFWESGVRGISEFCYQVSQGAPIGDLQKLLDQGIPADPPQDKDITPLGEAALLGNMEAVKLLIAHHADINGGGTINPDPKYAPFTRTSPLRLAACEGQDEIVAYLLQNGAKPEPAALWQAAENSYPYEEQRSKDHFEKTVRILIAAGAARNLTPEMAGMILSAPIQTRYGPPNATVLRMLLDSGLSPESPMPYIVDNGEKPNSVIGYFRDYYQKYKDHPTYGQEAATIKPLLDMLEAADKDAPKTDATVSPSTAAAAKLKEHL